MLPLAEAGGKSPSRTHASAKPRAGAISRARGAPAAIDTARGVDGFTGTQWMRLGGSIGVIHSASTTAMTQHDPSPDQSASQPDDPGFSNGFGAVTASHIVCSKAKDWVRPGTVLRIPWRHVKSVKLVQARKPALGVLLMLVGLVLANEALVLQVVAMALSGLGLVLFCGSPAVVVRTSSEEDIAALGLPWTRIQAQAFVDAVQQRLYDRQ